MIPRYRPLAPEDSLKDTTQTLQSPATALSPFKKTPVKQGCHGAAVLSLTTSGIGGRQPCIGWPGQRYEQSGEHGIGARQALRRLETRWVTLEGLAVSGWEAGLWPRPGAPLGHGSQGTACTCQPPGSSPRSRSRSPRPPQLTSRTASQGAALVERAHQRRVTGLELKPEVIMRCGTKE